MTKIIVATAQPETTRRWLGVMQPALPEFELSAFQPGQAACGAKYAIVWGPPAELFQVETQLEAIFNLGAGVDAILGLPGLPDIPVYRLEDAGMAPQMAEYVIHYLSLYSRGFEEYALRQKQSVWTPKQGIDYARWPVGVMGLGQLGTHVAKAVAALGYPTAGWARSPREEEGIETFHGNDQFKQFLARTRVLVNLLPLTTHTRAIINSDLLRSLMPEAVVINIARGAHVVDDDLLAALDAGKVKAAVLDVFNQEPLPSDHPYWLHPKVKITPHVAAVTLESDAVEQISRRIRLLEEGKPASGLVRRDTGY